MATTYKLFNLVKDEKVNINNQDVYLIVKGSAFLTTEFYSMIISEGSVINTSILLDLDMKDVKIKAWNLFEKGGWGWFYTKDWGDLVV